MDHKRIKRTRRKRNSKHGIIYRFVGCFRSFRRTWVHISNWISGTLGLSQTFKLPTDDNKFSTSDESDQEENPDQYCRGGYHRVKIGDTYSHTYQVIRKLGYGGFATVWLCRDNIHSRFVALKIVKSLTKCTTAALKEIKILQHANEHDPEDSRWERVVQLLDFFPISGPNGTHVAMVFDYHGENLFKLEARTGFGGIPLQNVKEIIRRVLLGVAYLHKCSIVHCDIKPENILVRDTKIQKVPAKVNPYSVTSELSVKLTDFGLSQFKDHLFTQIIQTRPYRCPEVYLGIPAGPPADIWSVACTAYELAIGHYLFGQYTGHEYSRDEYKLKQMVELLGDFPIGFALSGNHSWRYFTKDGKLSYVDKCKSWNLFQVLTMKWRWNANDAQEFADFLLPMLAFDPKERATASDCLEHRWLRS